MVAPQVTSLNSSDPIVNLNATIAVAVPVRVLWPSDNLSCSIKFAGLAAKVVQTKMKQNVQQRAPVGLRMDLIGN